MAIIGAENVYGPAKRSGVIRPGNKVRAYENIYSICAMPGEAIKLELKEEIEKCGWGIKKKNKTYKRGLKKNKGSGLTGPIRCAWLGRKNVLRVKAK